MFKDESAGDVISEFIGLRSKMYSVKFYGSTPDIKRVKGIAKNIVKKYINFDNYKKILLEGSCPLRHEMKTIRSIDHDIKLLSINKISLSCFDDRRYIFSDGIFTLPFGHKDINIVV